MAELPISDDALIEKAWRAFDAAACGAVDAIRDERWFWDGIKATVAVAQEPAIRDRDGWKDAYENCAELLEASGEDRLDAEERCRKAEAEIERLKADLVKGASLSFELRVARDRLQRELDQAQRRLNEGLGGVVKRWRDRAVAAEDRVSELEKERDTLATKAEAMEAFWTVSRRAHRAAETRVAQLEQALREAKNELGVPGLGYPAPIANAVEIIDAALSENTERACPECNDTGKVVRSVYVGNSGGSYEGPCPRGCGSEPCECRTGQPNQGEPYCPVHKYRWEYEQDERFAHRGLDEAGAPTAGPHGELLSVGGRIRASGGLVALDSRQAMRAICEANSAAHSEFMERPLRGAVTHSGAALLNALHDSGLVLARVDKEKERDA